MEKVVELINGNPNWTLIRATKDILVSFSFDIAEYIGAKHKKHERELFIERLFNETIKPLVGNDICYFYEKEEDSFILTINLYSNSNKIIYIHKIFQNKISMNKCLNEQGIIYLMISELDNKVVATDCYIDLFYVKLFLQLKKLDQYRKYDYKVFKVDLNSDSVFDKIRALGQGELITFLATR